MNLGKFINLVARWPGSVLDSHIFRTSQIQEYLESHHTSLEDGIILGDNGYALKRYLMTAYSDPTTAKERAFNRSLRKTRVLIEQLFGRWKRRFDLLLSEFRMKPVLVQSCRILQLCLMSSKKMKIMIWRRLIMRLNRLLVMTQEGKSGHI